MSQVSIKNHSTLLTQPEPAILLACSKSNGLGSNDEYVKAIKKSIVGDQGEMEEHTQALEAIELQESSILQMPQKSNFIPPCGIIE